MTTHQPRRAIVAATKEPNGAQRDQVRTVQVRGRPDERVEGLVDRWLNRSIGSQYLIGLFRPDDVAAGYVPAKASRMTQSSVFESENHNADENVAGRERVYVDH
jgi:hypothetical protein